MIHGAGSFLRRQSNQSQKVHRKDIATSKDSGKAIEASGDSTRATKMSGDSRKEVQAQRTAIRRWHQKQQIQKQRPEAEF